MENIWNDSAQELKELIEIGHARHLGRGFIECRKGTDEPFNDWNQKINEIDDYSSDMPAVIEIELDGIKMTGLIPAFDKGIIDHYMDIKRSVNVLYDAIDDLLTDKQLDGWTDATVRNCQQNIADVIEEHNGIISEHFKNAFGWSASC